VRAGRAQRTRSWPRQPTQQPATNRVVGKLAIQRSVEVDSKKYVCVVVVKQLQYGTIGRGQQRIRVAIITYLSVMLSSRLCLAFFHAFHIYYALLVRAACSGTVGFEPTLAYLPSASRIFVSAKRKAGNVPTITSIKAMKGPAVQPPNRPNACTYWVSDHLLAGEFPANKRGEEETRQRIRQYLDAGITLFLDLTQEGERPGYDLILKEEAADKNVPALYKRLPIRDFGTPNEERMKEILDTIDEAASKNGKTYVHCRGGIGRTGTVVGCYLSRHGNTGQEALDETNRLFQSSDRSLESWSSPETIEQINFVKNWNED